MLTERRESHVREGIYFMYRLPPIGLSHVSDGGKVIPHKELFLIQSYSTKVRNV